MRPLLELHSLFQVMQSKSRGLVDAIPLIWCFFSLVPLLAFFCRGQILHWCIFFILILIALWCPRTQEADFHTLKGLFHGVFEMSYSLYCLWAYHTAAVFQASSSCSLAHNHPLNENTVGSINNTDALAFILLTYIQDFTKASLMKSL